MSKRYRRSSVSVDVEIDEFDDDTLIAEVIGRGLVLKVLAEHNGEQEKQAPADEPPSLLERASDAQRWLMTRRIRDIIASLVPAELIEALDHAQAGRTSHAICALDHLIEPSPAATATTFPIKPTQPVEAQP